MPSWPKLEIGACTAIHLGFKRFPQRVETLALADVERIDRPLAERLFDLRRTAAADLLRRMGAEQCGRCWVIGRGLLMARLREMRENPDFRWEAERRERVAQAIEDLRRERRRAVVPVTEAEMERLRGLTVEGLPETIRVGPGQLVVSFAGMDDLLRQLMTLIQVIDNDFDAVASRVNPLPRKEPGSAGRLDRQAAAGEAISA